MHRLRDRRTQAVWSAECDNMFNVMFEGMLSWEGEPFRSKFSDPGLLEDGSITMKTIQSLLDVLQCGLGDCWASNEVAEVQKCGYGTYHISRHVALNCWEPYLFSDSQGMGCVLREKSMYLHECLRVITCPLVESSTFLKPAKTRVQWDDGNSTV